MFSPDTQRCSMMTLRNALKFPALKLQDLKRSLTVAVICLNLHSQSPFYFAH